MTKWRLDVRAMRNVSAIMLTSKKHNTTERRIMFMLKYAYTYACIYIYTHTCIYIYICMGQGVVRSLGHEVVGTGAGWDESHHIPPRRGYT